MQNLPVIAKEKNLNIFQKIRLGLFKKKINKPKFDINKYENVPEYIKKDDEIINKLIMIIKDKKNYSEQATPEEIAKMQERDLLKIPEDKLIEYFQYHIGILDFPIDIQIEFAKKEPNVINLKIDKINIINEAMKRRKYEFITIYPEVQKDVIDTIREEGILEEELPNIINYLNDPMPYIAENPNLIGYLDEQKQMKIFYNNKENLKYVSANIQLDYIKEHSEYAKYASDKVAEEFVKINKKNLAKTNLDFQLRVVQKYPNSYKYISKEAEKEIWSNPESKEAAKTAVKLLQKDIRYSKKFAEYGFNAISKSGGEDFCTQYYSELMEYLKNSDLMDTRKFFLHSKLLSSKGNLLSSKEIIHGMDGSEYTRPGIEDYNDEQKKIIQNLNLEQIKELISIDNNYILPYLMTKENKVDYLSLSDSERIISEAKCKELFASIYGWEKLTELNDCINIIYNRSSIKKEHDHSHHNGWYYYRERLDTENLFINEFKILFNRDIVENSSIEEIKEYFRKVEKEEDSQKEFYKLMQNAYGDKAVKILKSRPKLNVHTINSLETFDERIIDNFGEAFVHDLISYNIRDFQEFLDVVKDDKKLETFKIYYETLTKIMGNNVETMQRAISEYIYFDELMKNVEDVELTDEQYSNLASVLCSRDNQFNINTLQQLQNYDEISNEYIQKKIEQENETLKTKLERSGNTESQITLIQNAHKENISNIIKGDILGLRIDGSEVRDYGDILEDITNLYDISLENEEEYSEDEEKMMECLYFISQETDTNKLIQLANNLLAEKDIKNPVVMHRTVQKLKEHQTELFNSTLLTVEQMEELCESEKNNENPKITKEITEDRLEKYTLKGIDFKIIIHNSFGLPLEEVINSEMQIGNPYICARLITNKNITHFENKDKHCCYSSIKSAGAIVSYDSGDAGTDHLAKRVRGMGGHKDKINSKIDNTWSNEIAQYRRYRDHKDISNENRGGKFLPDFIMNPSSEEIEIMKKYNIPILEIDREKYRELEEREKKEKNRKNPEQKEER